MSRVDFYFISQPGLQARLLFACRLLEKAYQQEQPVYVHLESEEKARFFDQLLWTYRDDSFIPHHLVEEKPSFNSPIQLGYQTEPATQAEILLSLGGEIPAFHERFKRILEILPPETNPAAKADQIRDLYAAKGYTINSHQIR
jgi:DNA polymerase-3 subunit chi